MLDTTSRLLRGSHLAPVAPAPAPVPTGGVDRVARVECAQQAAYRRRRAGLPFAGTTFVPRAAAWRTADSRPALPHGASSPSSPPV